MVSDEIEIRDKENFEAMKRARIAEYEKRKSLYEKKKTLWYYKQSVQNTVRRTVSFDEGYESLGSKDGTAKYRDRRDKHIICYNDTIKPRGRIQWTLAHELGHIELGHLRDFPETGTKHPALKRSTYRIFEAEADVFARELLAPSTVFISIAETYNVREPLCFYTIARSIFRLSLLW